MDVSESFPQWYRNLSSQFKKFFRRRQFVDVIFHCADGKKVFCHQFLLSLTSPLFRELFSGFQDDTAQVSIPDVTSADFSFFVESLLCGELEAFAENLRDSWLALVELFRIPSGSHLEVNTEDKKTGVASSLTPSEPENSPLGADPFQVEVIQTPRGEMVILPMEESLTPNPDIPELTIIEHHPEGTRERHEPEEVECPICSKSAFEHKVELLNDENGFQPGAKFSFQCCLIGCNFKMLRNIKAFELHMKRHGSDSGLASPSQRVCPLCFKSKLEHKNRNASDLCGRKGSKGSLYKCCLCKASKLTGTKKFYYHVENHIEKKFCCDVCSKGFSHKHLLDSHRYKEHGEGQNEKLRCSFENCDFETKYRQTLSTHIKLKHEGKSRLKEHGKAATQTVSCPACGKELKKWYYNQIHKKTCSLKTSLFNCDICNQTGFVSKVTLSNHIKAKHSNERPHQCEYCSARYSTAMSLSSHRVRKHNVNKCGDFIPKKMFPCATCGSLLTSRSKLNNHIRTIHEGEKRFQCSHCEKKFTSRSNMNIHEGLVHTGILPYKCSVCSKMFSRKQLLQSHIDNVHAVDVEMSTNVEENSQQGSFFIVESTTQSGQTIVPDIILS